MMREKRKKVLPEKCWLIVRIAIKFKKRVFKK
jgi:hypothetical protein